jgi:PAS domain S-box-containing protein
MQRLIIAQGHVCGGWPQGAGSSALSGHWLIDAGTMLMRVSPGFCEVLGIGRTASLPFQTFLETVHPDNRRRVEALVDEAPNEIPAAFDERIRIVHPDGAMRSVTIRGEIEIGARGRVVSVFGTAEAAAATGQGEVQHSHCAERERFRAYFEHSPEALFAVRAGADGRLIYEARNSAYAELIGLPRGVMPGRGVDDLVPERIADELMRHCQECLDLGRAITCEEILDLEDGLRIWSLTLAPVPGSQGGVLGIARDITGQRMLEASLRAARDAAEAADRERSTLLAHASHVLRTPLNAVIGYSDMLMGGIMGPVGSRPAVDAVTAINEAGQQVLSLVEELIDLARLEEDASTPVDEQSVDLDYILRDTWRSVAPESAKRGTSLRVEIPPATPNLWADEWAVRRVVQVLLSNAVKFTRQGEILVTVEVPNGLSSDGLSVVVRDTGVGIAADRLPAIMERFTLLDPIKRGPGGMGIGLRLATRLMDRHGGRLTIESELGAGTTVRATFPSERVVSRSFQDADPVDC